MPTYTSIFLSIFFLYGVNSRLEVRPKFLFHGLGTSCEIENTRYWQYGFECVETGAGFQSMWPSISDQAEKACQYFRTRKTLIANGFYILAVSQGGLIARKMMHKCPEVGSLVRRIVFVGTPHLGVDKLPPAEAFRPIPWTHEQVEQELERQNGFIERLEPEDRKWYIESIRALGEVHLSTREKWQNVGMWVLNSMGSKSDILNAAPTNYYNPEDGYSDFIADLNSPENDKFYDNLELMVCVTNHDERVISPVESTMLGYRNFHKTVNKNYLTSNTPFFKSQVSGIGGLWFDRKLLLCGADTSHAQLKDEEIMAVLILFQETDARGATYEESAKKMRDLFLKNYMEKCEVRGRIKIFDEVKPLKLFI